MKRCFKCGQVKPLSEFYKHSRMADGHFNKCKECAKKDSHENRASNLEHYRGYDRARSSNPDRLKSRREYAKTPRGKLAKAKAERNYRERHPEKALAHNIFRSARARGDIQRPAHCRMCGSTEKIEAHHPNYSKPLFVLWLCEKCHKLVHREKRIEERKPKMKIYEIAPALRMIFEEAYVDEDAVFHFDQVAFDEIAGNAREKIANCGRFIREEEDEIEAMKRAEKAIAERRKTKEKTIERLKAMTLHAVEALGEKVEMPDIRVSTRKSTKVEVDETMLHADWFVEKIERKPNLRALGEALKQGVVIEGAQLVVNHNLAIK